MTTDTVEPLVAADYKTGCEELTDHLAAAIWAWP